MAMSNEVLAKNYLEWKRTYAPKAYDRYKIHIERFIRLIRKPLDKIHLEDIVHYQRSLKTEYPNSNMVFSLTVVKNFLLFNLKQGRIQFDPSMIRIPKEVVHSHLPVEPDEFKKMYDSIQGMGIWDVQNRLFIGMLWDTGVRISELTEINYTDLDLEKRMVMVITKKTRQPRWVLWSERTHKDLVDFLPSRKTLGVSPALFIGRKTGVLYGRMCPRTAERWVKQIAYKAGINKKISPHSFRHGRAHEILRKGGHVAEVAKILGHVETNPSSAFRYLRLNDHEHIQMAKRFLD